MLPLLPQLESLRSRERQAPLLGRVAAGDPDAVAACIERFGPLVRALAHKAVREPAQAEDVVQETFIDVWLSAGRYDPTVASETTFVATIARRRLIDRHRRVAARPESEPLPDEVGGVEERGFTDVEDRDEAAHARAFLASLPPDRRRVFEMSFVQGCSHREIAHATGLPLGTVKSHLRRGLEHVRSLIERAGALQAGGARARPAGRWRESPSEN